LLGSLDVQRDGVAVPLGRSKLRTLLAILLLEVNRTVPLDRIAERLWDDEAPPSARSTIHVYTMRLRRTLGDGLILTRPTGYQLQVDPGHVDVATFHSLLERARQAAGDPATESALLTEALGLWRGPALQDIPSDYLHRAVVPRLVEERLRASERRLELDLRLGRHADLIGELTDLTREHPTREGFWVLLMLTLCRLGRRVEALEAYRQVNRHFRDELGIDPSEPIQRLHREILAGKHDASGDDDAARALDQARPAGAAAPAESAPPVTPSQLPPDVHAFAGRAEPVDDVIARLATPATPAMPVVILSGPPGVGKTALAIRVAHQVRGDYPDGQLYANLQGYSPGAPLSPSMVLARFLRALGVPADRVPTDEEDQTALYRSLLADRRVLVVLDNAADPGQVRPLLPGQPGCAALVTSRDDLRGLVALDGGRPVPVRPLSVPESRAVLDGLVDAGRVAAEPAAVDRLAAECAGLPLALRIAAANLLAHPHQSIDEYADALRMRGRLVQLQVPGDEQAAVRAAFDLSYARLDPAAARLFRLLSAVPGPDFDAAAAAALTGVDPLVTEMSLDALAAANLIFASAAGRYQFHDLVREYAASRAAADNTLHNARIRLWDFYLHTARNATQVLYPDFARLPPPSMMDGVRPLTQTDEPSALAWLDGELPNLAAAAALAATDPALRSYAWRLADALGGYFWGRTTAVESVATCEAALTAARAAGDWHAEATMLDLIGMVHFAQSRYDLARDYHVHALAIHRRNGDLDGQATSLYFLGRIGTQVGPPERAARYHREALALAERTGNQDAQTLNTNYMGVAWLSACRIEQAIQSHMRAVELNHGTGNQTTLARILGGLGNTAWYAGDLRMAIAFYQETAEMGRRLGIVSLAANSLICTAEAHCDLGDYEAATSCAEEGAALARRVGERRIQLGATEILATARLRGGQGVGVIDDYRRALHVAREINFRFGEISLRVALAAAHRAGGAPAAAVEHAEWAIRRIRHTGIRGNLEGRALTELGLAHLDLGDTTDAETCLGAAVQVAHRDGTRLVEARARHAYGLVLREAGEATAARPHWQAALETFERIGTPEAHGVRALLAAAAPA
jgi:DNA-binding SARP family transcriptional activator/tetratricopeptide (TPR) repeat protein